MHKIELNPEQISKFTSLWDHKSKFEFWIKELTGGTIVWRSRLGKPEHYLTFASEAEVMQFKLTFL